MTPLEAVPDIPVVMPEVETIPPHPESDPVRKYAVRFQIVPGETQTHVTEDELNPAILERNRLWLQNEIGRVWIDVVSGECVLRRWGAVFKRDWATLQ